MVLWIDISEAKAVVNHKKFKGKFAESPHGAASSAASSFLASIFDPVFEGSKLKNRVLFGKRKGVHTY